MIAVTTHGTIIRPAELVSRAISAATMKIPEPIMDPITMVVASNSPRPLIRPAFDSIVEAILPSAGEDYPRCRFRQQVSDDCQRVGSRRKDR